MEFQQLKAALRSALVATALLFTACDSERRGRCEVTDVDGFDVPCTASVIFAARDSAALVPLDAEVAAYYSRWSKAVMAEPLLARYLPQVYRSTAPTLTNIITTNVRVIAAWSQTPNADPAPPTGDAGFDAIMGELISPRIYSASDLGNGAFAFSFQTGALFNEELLNERLLTTSSHLPERTVRQDSDGMWTWLDGDSTSDHAAAEVLFRVGWGDCLSGCIWFHDLRVDMPATGEATVYDLGGDPLPAGMELSPQTRPPP